MRLPGCRSSLETSKGAFSKHDSEVQTSSFVMHAMERKGRATQQFKVPIDINYTSPAVAFGLVVLPLHSGTRVLPSRSTSLNPTP